MAGAPAELGGGGDLTGQNEGSIAHLRRGSQLNLIGAVITTACTLGVALATTRALHEESAGVVFALTSAFLVAAAVLRLGTPMALVRFIARRPDPDGSRTRAFGRAATRAVTPAAIGAVIIGLGAAGVLGRLAPESAFGRAPGLMAGLAVVLPFAVLLDVVLAISRGHHQMGPTVAIERIARPAAQLVLSVAAWLWWPTIVGLGLAWALPYVPALLAAFRATPQLRDPGPVAEVAPEERREFRSFLLSRSFVSVSQILFARLDVVLLALIAGTAEAAIYTAATRFVVVAQLVQNSIGTAVEPGLAAAVESGERGRTRRLYATGTMWLVALAWPLLLACAVTAPWWLAIFGTAYVAGEPVVLVLVAAMLVSTGIGTVETLLNMAGRARSLVFYNLGGLAIMIGLDLALIPSLGALGAAIGWAATICFKNIIPLIETRRTLGIHPASPGWAVAGALSVLTCGVLPLAGRLLAGGLGLAVCLALGLGVWGGSMLWWRREQRRPLGRHARSKDVHTPV